MLTKCILRVRLDSSTEWLLQVVTFYKIINLLREKLIIKANLIFHEYLLPHVIETQ